MYFFTHSDDTNQPQNQVLTQDQTCASMSNGGDSDDLWMKKNQSINNICPSLWRVKWI